MALLKQLIDLTRDAISRLTGAGLSPSVRVRQESAEMMREVSEQIAKYEGEAVDARNVAREWERKAEAALAEGHLDQATLHVAEMTKAQRNAHFHEAGAERGRRALAEFGRRLHMVAAQLDDLERQQERIDEVEAPWGGRRIPWRHRHLVKEIDALKLQAATAFADERRAERVAADHRAELARWERMIERTMALQSSLDASALTANLLERAQLHRAGLADAEREAERFRTIAAQQRVRLKELWGNLDRVMKALDI